MTHEKKDGGAAFPVQEQVNENGVTVVYAECGLTKREWFAGMALQGLIGGRTWDLKGDALINQWARSSYALADAMLREGGSDV